MDQEISFRKVSIRPIELLKEAKNLVGDQYWLFVGIVFVGILIGSLVPFGILMGSMMCGIYLCYLRKSQNQQVTFDMLFKGMDYFVEGLIVMLINIAVSVVVMAPMYLLIIVPLMAHERPGLVSLVFVVLVLVQTIITLWFLFAYLLIVDRGLQAIPAIKASGRAGLANAGGLVGMLLLYGLISCLGACCCYVPAVLFSPLFFGAVFLAYREIFPAA
jgi:hypothetical protein